MKWLQILDEMKKNYFEKSQKNQDLSTLTKSPIEIKDVHIEFDDLHNNDIQNGKLCIDLHDFNLYSYLYLLIAKI